MILQQRQAEKNADIGNRQERPSLSITSLSTVLFSSSPHRRAEINRQRSAFSAMKQKRFPCQYRRGRPLPKK